MIFTSPSYIPDLKIPPPDSVPIHDFLFGQRAAEDYGRYPMEASEPPFTCSLTGTSYTAAEVRDRIELLATALADQLKWEVGSEKELDKVLSIYSENTIDTLPVSWAAHRLSGVANNISATYTQNELTHQLLAVKASAIFTSPRLLHIALASAQASGIPRQNVYLLATPPAMSDGVAIPHDIKTVNDLIESAKSSPPIAQLSWVPGQGARQTAFLCCSSGTSGTPKNVKISHMNVIAIVLQLTATDSTFKPLKPELCLGVLPLSHNFALMAVAHLSVYRGDGVVIAPRFDLLEILGAIHKYKIGKLCLVPAMIMAMLGSLSLVQQYDLSHVNTTIVGASVLPSHVAAQFSEMLSGCHLLQGYGLTETTVAVTLGNPGDSMFGSCGHLLPGCKARLIDDHGKDVDAFEVPGRLLIQAPTVMIGYLNNEKADREVFLEGGWLDTGDLVMFRLSPAGHGHLFLVDRIKELIKVRGMQVSPTEVENHLLTHPIVKDCVVVALPHESGGELPLAYITRRPAFTAAAEEECRDSINAHMATALADHKQLHGGIVFVDALPRSSNGKIQRGEIKKWAALVAEEQRRQEKLAAQVQVFVFDSDDDDDDDDVDFDDN